MELVIIEYRYGQGEIASHRQYIILDPTDFTLSKCLAIHAP